MLRFTKVSPTSLTLYRPIIDRPGIEEQIEIAMTEKPLGLYYVIYGAVGAGNSTLVEKVALGKEAVIRVSVNLSDRTDEITANITEAVTGK